MKKQKSFSYKELATKGIPAILIPGLILASTLGWKGNPLQKTNYYDVTELFPHTGIVRNVSDGDTFQLQNGQVVRLIGVDAPNRGDKQYDHSKEMLASLIQNKKVYLEYDRYQDDKYGRILSWVWINCESSPHFLPPDYMHKSQNASKEGLILNPKGCQKGTLVNEQLIISKAAELIIYADRGELKYQQRIQKQQK